MFSGIVEEYATLVALVKDQENIHFTFKCSFVNELKIDQSISHNGGPEFAKTYFDYEKFARDLFMCDYWFDDGFVFRAA